MMTHQRPLPRLGILLVTVALMLTTWQPTAAQSSDQRWNSVGHVANSVNLTSVSMLDAVHGYAAGYNAAAQLGVIYQLVAQGTRWSTFLVFQQAQRLWEVVALNDTAVWVVGDKGLIMHRTGSTWAQVDPGLTTGSLTTIQMLGNGEEGWAGGYETDQTGIQSAVLLHYRGGHWQRDGSVGGRGAIMSLHLAPGGGWAVGTEQFWHYANGHWGTEPGVDLCGGATGCFPQWDSVRALSADEAWAAGSMGANCAICQSHMHMLHRTAAGWQEATPAFTDIQHLPATPCRPSPPTLGNQNSR